MCTSPFTTLIIPDWSKCDQPIKLHVHNIKEYRRINLVSIDWSMRSFYIRNMYPLIFLESDCKFYLALGNPQRLILLTNTW